MDGLKSKRKAYIYHCFDHYMFLLGYDLTPKNPMNAFSPAVEDSKLFIIMGDPCPFSIPMLTKSSNLILLDLSTPPGKFLNIRGSSSLQDSPLLPNNLVADYEDSPHCILSFQS